MNYSQKPPLKYRFLPNFIIIFLLFYHTGISQNASVIDSLLSILHVEKNDTLRVDAMNELAWEYKIEDSKKAKDFAKDAIELSKKIIYQRGQITAMTRLGTVFIYEKEYNKAEAIYLKVLVLEKEDGYTYGIGRAQNQLSEIYSNKNQLTKALNYSLESLASFEKINNENLVAVVSNKIGSIYTNLGNYEKAIAYLLQSLDRHLATNSTENIASTSASIGLLYYSMEDYDKSIEYLTESKTLFEKVKNRYELAKAYNNIGIVELWKDNYDKALRSFETSFSIKKELDVLDKDPGIYNNFGNLYHKKNQLNKALEYYLKSERILEKQEKNENVDVIINMADIYYKKNQLNKAVDYYEKALLKAEKTGQNLALLKIFNDLSLCYSKIDNYNLALKYKNKYIQLHDTLDSTYKKAIKLKADDEEKKKKIELLEKDEEVTKADLKRTKAENKYKDTLIYSLLVGVVLVLLLFFSIIRGNRRKQRMIIAEKDKEIEKQKAQDIITAQELRFNQARLDGQEKERKRIAKDLHDRLGSMLSMVKIHYKSVEENVEKLKKSNKEQYEKANLLLDEACEEVRKIANDMNSGILSKFGLVAALEDLAHALNSTDQLEVEFNIHGVDNRLHAEMEEALYRVLQELINNVLKHAKAKEVSIQLIQSDTILVVMVEDNGVGFDYENMKDKGMGLTNVASRVEKLKGDIQIDSSLGNGTTITIEIPIIE